MTTEVIQTKKKSSYWILWAVLLVVLAFVAWKNLDVVKPAASQAYDSLRTAVSSVLPEAAAPAAQANAAAPAPAQVDAVSTLDNARLAFSNGDLQAALAAYKEYVARNAGDLDARGELGNVYYISGNYQEAAQTYYDLSKILIDQKQLDMVPALLPVIGQVNPGLADELVEKMNQVQQQMPENQQGQSFRQG